MSGLDQQREHIQDDLRGLVSGEVRCDDAFRQLYASDASIHEIRPLGVVRPRSTDDVVACVRYAREKRLSLCARGAGTSVAGESLGAGLVVDFSAHQRRLIRVEPDWVRLQPGLVHARLNAQLRGTGRCFGPDPAGSPVTTLGSVIALDAAGSRWLKYGSARRCVRSLLVVMADGQTLELGREPLAEGLSTSSIPRKRELVNQLAALLGLHADRIRQCQPKCPVNHLGYQLSDLLGKDYLDVGRLLAGSEGTLGLIAEASLETDPLPRSRGVALLLFESLDKAARTVLEILPTRPSACDLMDRRHLTLAREADARFEALVPAETEAALLVEQEGDDPLEVHDRLRQLVDDLWHQRRLVFGARQAFEADEVGLIWHLVDRVRPTLYQLKGPSRPVPVVEDMAVPPESLPDFLVRMQNVLKRHQVTASVFGHAGQGQLHVEPFLDLSNPEDVGRLRPLADELYQQVLAVEGTISGEHGCGLSRTGFVRRQAGPLYEVFAEVKRIFDPENIFNPGKIVGDDSDLLTRYVRPPILGAAASAPPRQAGEAPSMRSLIELQLNWQPARVADAVEACNRCGDCRTQELPLRMCPIFRAGPAEDASPRAKANLLRGILTGKLDLMHLTTSECKAIADLCVHCHACRLECPAAVDIPRLARESKAAYVESNGLPLTEWFVTRLDLLGMFGGMVAPVANWALGNRQMRWLMEKTMGIAQGRKLPRVASRSFLRRAARRRLTRPSRRSGQKVVYFVDVYANYFDPQLAEALVAVLEHNGVAVYVHPGQKQAGMASIACGALDHARGLARHNVSVLAEAVRQGYHVVATEPAAALCLVHEYPQLIDDDDARLLAANSREACSYLWSMHTRGQLQLDFRPLSYVLGYHTPCHLRALRIGTPGENLLGLIPGLTVRHIEAGCSGMAGTFGLLDYNFRSSLRAGWKLISRLRDSTLNAGTTECSACKTQMEQGTNKPTLHPIKLLALAYGLMPEIGGLLAQPNEELRVT